MEKFDYAGAVAELEEIVSKVEDPSTGLEEIDALIIKTQKLTAACRDYLRGVGETLEEL